jgi:hypothetical protein
MYPVTALAKQIESEWASELAVYFEKNVEDIAQKIRPWLAFPSGTLRIELMDGSLVEFQCAIYIASEPKKAIGVFTEHCGNHIYPYHDAKVYRNEVLVYEQI